MSTVTIPAGIPTPVRVKTPDNDLNIGSDKRTYEIMWTVGGTVPGRFDPSDENNGIRLTITHYKSTKDYRATVKVIRVQESGHREAFSFVGPRLDADLGGEYANRYSRKALDMFATDVLAAFPGSIPEDTEPGRMWARIVLADDDARLLRKFAG